MSTSLEAYIESLLRARLPQLIDAGQPKPPVLGGSSISYGSIPQTVPPILFEMETGLYSFSVSPIYPLSVYAGTELQSYLSGIGTPIPDSDLVFPHVIKYEYLIPEAVLPTTCPDWPDTAVTLGLNQEYPSQIYTADVNTLLYNNPAQYTGLMRLAVQAKIGGGKNADQLTPWTPSGETHGLFRTETFVYWIVNIGSGGCFARRLADTMPCVRDWLTRWQAGTLTMTAEDAVRLEAWLMSTLYVDNTTANLELLTALELDNVYNGRESVAHGWKFPKGLHQATITTFRPGIGATQPAWYFESTLALIDFVITDTTITATLNIQEQDVKFVPGAGKLFRPVAGVSQWVHQPSVLDVWDTPVASAPFYSFYGAGDLLHVCRSSYAYATSTPLVDATLMTECGQALAHRLEEVPKDVGTTGGYWIEQTAIDYTRVIAPIVDSIDHTLDLGSVTSKSTTITRSAAAAAVNVSCNRPDPAVVSTDFTETVTSCFWLDLTDLSSTVATGGSTQTKITATENRTDSGRIFVISGNAPDAVYLAEGWTATRDESVAVRTEASDKILSGTFGDLTVGFHNSSATSLVLDPAYPLWSPVQVSDTVCVYPSQTSDLVGINYFNTIPIDPVVTSSNGVVSDHYTAHILTGMNEKELTTAGAWIDWASFRNVDFNTDIVSNTLPVSESYLGKIEYYQTPSSLVLEGGYTAAAVLSDYKRWSGFS